MIRVRALVLFAAVCVFGFFDPAVAAKRVALIVANGAYRYSGELENPPHDARLLTAALKQADFEVMVRVNAGQKALKKAFRDYTAKLKSYGPDTVGLFYYSGHGTQVNGRNYLIPVDANIENEAQVDSEAISAVALMAQLEGAENKMNIVILDSCRNNPFKRGYRSQIRGLARMDAPRSTLIAYSTEPGNVALDGSQGYSPYAIALHRAMRRPGIAVEQAFKLVRNEVSETTGGKQTPWEESSLFGDFYFKRKASDEEGNDKSIGPPPPWDIAKFADEATIWKDIRASRDPESYRSYLTKYPSGTFALLATDQLEGLAEEQEEAAAKVAQAPSAGVYFIDNFDGDELAKHWDVMNPDEDAHIVEDGRLTVLLTDVEKPTMENTPNILRLLKPVPKGDWTITAKLDFAPQTMSEWFSMGIGRRDGRGMMTTLQVATSNYGRDTRFYFRGDKKSRKESRFTQEVYKMWVDDGRNIVARTDLFSKAVKSVLLRLEKKGRRYIASGRFEPASAKVEKSPAREWVALPKLTSLRLPGDKFTLIMRTSRTDKHLPDGTEGLVNVDWVKIETPGSRAASAKQ